MFDLIIIGGGPAGLTSGIYALRSGLKTLLLEKMVPGGQVLTTYEIENYPGFKDKVLGSELIANMEEQAKNLGLEIKLEEVIDLNIESDIKVIKTLDNTYNSKAVIVATGATPKSLAVPNEEQFRGKGVSYCATCDGFFFRNKNVAIVGGGNTALEEALYLSKIAASVTVIHRRQELRASKILQERAFNNEKISFLLDSIVQELIGENKLSSVMVKNVKTNEIKELQVDGLFVAIGLNPNSKIVEGKLELIDGFIKTDENMYTSVPGVFAAGDVRYKQVRQIVTAASDGAIAAVMVEKYVKD